MTKLEKIKEEIELVAKGMKYIENPKTPQSKIDDFMPRLSDKMKALCQLVADLEKETGRKFDWNNPDLIYDLGEQLNFTKELMKK